MASVRLKGSAHAPTPRRRMRRRAGGTRPRLPTWTSRPEFPQPPRRRRRPQPGRATSSRPARRRTTAPPTARSRRQTRHRMPPARRSCPAPANTATAIASPNTPPSWRIVLNVPEALPISSGATALDDRVLGGRESPSRCPRRRAPAAGPAASRPGPAWRSGRSRPSPPACSVSPATISGRSPIRSTSAPAIGRDDEQRRRPRQQPQPGAERPIARARSAGTGP